MPQNTSSVHHATKVAPRKLQQSREYKRTTAGVTDRTVAAATVVAPGCECEGTKATVAFLFEWNLQYSCQTENSALE